MTVQVEILAPYDQASKTFTITATYAHGTTGSTTATYRNQASTGAV